MDMLQIKVCLARIAVVMSFLAQAIGDTSSVDTHLLAQMFFLLFDSFQNQIQFSFRHWSVLLHIFLPLETFFNWKLHEKRISNEMKITPEGFEPSPIFYFPIEFEPHWSLFWPTLRSADLKPGLNQERLNLEKASLRLEIFNKRLSGK